MRTRAANFDLMGHQYAFSRFNEWLVERWEERRQEGVWKESDRPKDQDRNARLWMETIAEQARLKTRFGTHPKE